MRTSAVFSLSFIVVLVRVVSIESEKSEGFEGRSNCAVLISSSSPSSRLVHREGRGKTLRRSHAPLIPWEDRGRRVGTGPAKDLEGRTTGAPLW